MPDGVHLALAALVPALVVLGILLESRRHARPVDILATPPPPDPAVAARFGRRRKGCLLGWTVLGPAALALLFTRKEPLVVAAMVTLGALVALVFVTIRCPACGELPQSAGSGPDNDGLDLFPDECPHCGAKLKERKTGPP